MSYQFQGQRQAEVVYLITHQHPLVLLPRLLPMMVVALIPIATFAFIGFGSATWLASICCWPIALFLLGEHCYAWNATLLLVTNERIVFMEQHGFFKRELVECSLSGVQQVSHSVHGVLATVAGFGDLAISTSGSLKPITIPHIPNPYGVQQEMLAVQRGETFADDESESFF
jgi:hypothetical protein